MRIVVALFGNYGVGKTFLSKQNTNNVVALAYPIRSMCFKLFKDDKYFSSKQEDKEALIDVPKVITKPKGFPAPLFDNLMGCIDNFSKTRRGMLQAVGEAGRMLSKDYWAQKAYDQIQQILDNGQNTVFVDDLRYCRELKILKKLEKQGDVKVLVGCVTNGEILTGYELQKLIPMADFTIETFKGMDRSEIVWQGRNLMVFNSEIIDFLKFLLTIDR